MIEQIRLMQALKALGNGQRFEARVQRSGEEWMCHEMIDLDDPVSKSITEQPKRWKHVKAHGATPIKAANNFLKILPRRIDLKYKASV